MTLNDLLWPFVYTSRPGLPHDITGVGSEFFLTVEGMCEHVLFFGQWGSIMSASYWPHFKDRKVRTISVCLFDGLPELYVRLM